MYGTAQPNGTTISLVTADGVQTFDPWRIVPGMPPGRGESLMPHVMSFQSMAWTGARVYRPSDEALRDSRANASYMRNDTLVMECVEQRQRSTALLDWHIEVENEDDPQQASLRDELTGILRRLPYFVKYREALLNAIWYGRYAVQNRYEWSWIKGQRRVIVADWLPIHGDKLVWKFDADRGDYNPDQLGIRVTGGAGFGRTSSRWKEENADRIEATDWGMAYYLEPWERDLVVVHKHLIEDGEYEDPESAGRICGVGIRHRIYWTWYQKQEALAWLMEYLERSGFGMELWYYPYGNQQAESDYRKAATERIGQGRNIVLVPRLPGPDALAYGVERIEPGMAGANALKEILTEYFGHQIKRYVLGQTLTTEAHATGLGSNLASIHLDTYLQIIKYDARNLEETITRQLIGPLVRFNWPAAVDVDVRFVLETDSPDVEERLQAWRHAWEMGARLREKDVMDLIGAAVPSEEDRVLQNPLATSTENPAGGAEETAAAMNMPRFGGTGG